MGGLTGLASAPPAFCGKREPVVSRKPLFLLVSLVLASCGEEEGDVGIRNRQPIPQGPDRRIREVANPTSPTGAKNDEQVAISGAVVVAVDAFDETENGRSRGTIWVQDMGSTEPYSGISLFAPTFVPGNLKVGVGDVLDLRGSFVRVSAIGTASFAPGSSLSQIAQPIATFRYEYQAPEPREIDINDLASFEKGQQWNGMLVRVRNVTVQDIVGARSVRNGRLGVELLPPAPGAENGCEAPFPKPPTLVNSLANVQALEIPRNTVLKSVTGIVAFFCNYQLAPRSASDIEL